MEGGDAAIPAAPASFDSINNDCVVNILSFLPIDDLNTVATVSQGCCEARNHESLDQTRAATIVCSATKNPTIPSLVAALNAASDTLTANYTKLRIVGLEKIDTFLLDEPATSDPLMNITSLELCGEDIPHGVLKYVSQFLPNVTCLTLEGFKSAQSHTGNFHLGFFSKTQASDMEEWPTSVGL